MDPADPLAAPGRTTLAQAEVEAECAALLRTPVPPLDKAAHARFLRTPLRGRGFGRGFSSLDASQPWLLYWALQGLDTLNELATADCQGVVAQLRRCEAAEGGFGGGPGQRAHVLASFAASRSLAIVGSPEAVALARSVCV